MLTNTNAQFFTHKTVGAGRVPFKPTNNIGLQMAAKSKYECEMHHNSQIENSNLKSNESELNAK